MIREDSVNKDRSDPAPAPAPRKSRPSGPAWTTKRKTEFFAEHPADDAAELDDEYRVGTRNDYAIVVGIKSHLIVSELLRQGPLPSDRLERTTLLLSTARRVLVEHPAKVRPQSVLAQSVGSAAAYVHRFAPSDPWRLRGAEVRLDGCRMDLVFVNRHSQVVVADELKFGADRKLDSAIRPQIEAYLEAGTATWGDRFAGVRLCCVSAPDASRFYPVGRRRSFALNETPWWRMGGD
jgi:hypothetical protein